MNRFIGDWHYSHKNAIAFDNRPFTSVEEMNEKLVQWWNETTSPEDNVYILGDMFWCGSGRAKEVLDQLNGKLILVKGNHDDRWLSAGCRDRFDQIADYVMEIHQDGKLLVLCHYPFMSFRNSYHGAYHLYAHVHTSFEANMVENHRYQMEQLYLKPCNMFNVGVMMPYMQYRPRTLEEIENGYQLLRSHHPEEEKEDS